MKSSQPDSRASESAGAPGLRSALLLAACGVGLLFFSGCVTEPESHVLSSPPPPVPASTVAGTATQPTTVTTVPAAENVPSSTTTTTTTTADGVTRQQTVVVNSAPPVVQQEVVLARPSAQHVWVPGYWTWRNNRYEWMAGHWEIPPFSGATWVAPHTEPVNGAYRFYEGYWR